MLLGHVAVAGEEPVDAAVVAMGDDATFYFGVIGEAVAEAEAVTRGEWRLREFHAGDCFGLEELVFICGAAAEKKLDEFGEFGGRGFYVSGGAQIDFLLCERVKRLSFGGVVTFGGG